jgi:hypothetical protein
MVGDLFRPPPTPSFGQGGETGGGIGALGQKDSFLYFYYPSLSEGGVVKIVISFGGGGLKYNLLTSSCPPFGQGGGKR